MINRKSFLPFLLILFAQFAFSQTTDAEKAEEFKKQAVEFLRETGQEVKNLRSLENRISFSAEIAGLMWFHDEKEARTMYKVTITDFQQLLLEINTQYNGLDAAEQTEDIYDDYMYGGSEGSAKGNLLRKFEKAMGVRRQIALSIAEHDAPMGYNFFTSTAQTVTNQSLAKISDSRDGYFEIRLIEMMAEQDIDKAIEAARKLLAKDKLMEIFGLLQKIYAKDDKKGASLGEEFISKAKSVKNESGMYYLFSAILRMGVENLEKLKDTPDKKPLFSENSLREIADLFGQEILKSDEMDSSMAEDYAKLIEKFAPARASQIRLKFKKKETTNNTASTDEVATRDTISRINRQKESAEQQKEQKQLFDDVKKLEDKKLPKEDRDKIIAKVREIIKKVKDREQKVLALSLLASQVAAFGDKELAGEIMTEARNLVPFQPKNYKDYLSLWMLSSGYAQVDTEKAFPLLEDTVFRLNETIAAFIKVAEFIDVRGEFIEDEEVQVGSFGGEITRGLLQELGAANLTLSTLAKADFPRTKSLTNKFDRLEVRILAKMLVLRAVLGEQKKKDEK